MHGTARYLWSNEWLTTLTNMQWVIVAADPINDCLFLRNALCKNYGGFPVLWHGLRSWCGRYDLVERLPIRFRTDVEGRRLKRSMDWLTVISTIRCDAHDVQHYANEDPVQIQKQRQEEWLTNIRAYTSPFPSTTAVSWSTTMPLSAGID